MKYNNRENEAILHVFTHYGKFSINDSAIRVSIALSVAPVQETIYLYKNHQNTSKNIISTNDLMKDNI